MTQFNLGVYYQNGWGVGRDTAEDAGAVSQRGATRLYAGTGGAQSVTGEVIFDIARITMNAGIDYQSGPVSVKSLKKAILSIGIEKTRGNYFLPIPKSE